MAKGKQLAVAGNKKQFIEVKTIAASPALRAKLQSCIDEVVAAKVKILDQNEQIKSVRDAAVEELNIDPKIFNALVALTFNNNFDQKLEEMARLDEAIKALMQTPGDSSDDE